MKGLAVLQGLRERPDRADVPIVIVGADAAPGQQKRPEKDRSSER